MKPMKGSWTVRRYMGKSCDEVWHTFSPPDHTSYDNTDIILLVKRKGVWLVDDSFADDYAWRPIGVRTLKEAKLIAVTLWRMR